MSDADEKRAFLNDWIGREGHVDEVAEAYPACGCETATPADGGHGPVLDREKLRFFIPSRSVLDKKRTPNKAITSNIFKRAFSKGMSVVRMEKAPYDEVLRAAQILYDFQVGKDAEYGGIVGAVDFEALKVRWSAEGTNRLCCVLDTPLPERPAHADVVHHDGSADEENERNLRSILFNQIGGTGAFKPVELIDDTDLSALLPECMKAQS